MFLNNNNIHQQNDGFMEKAKKAQNNSSIGDNIKPEPELSESCQNIPADNAEECHDTGVGKNFSSDINMSASIKAYADRMQADYFRYRLAKESADNFYNRLAAVHNTFNHFRNYFNPFMMRSFGLNPPVNTEHAGVDMCLKPMPHPGQHNPNFLQPPLPLHLPYLQNFQESGAKKRGVDDVDQDHPGVEKKAKLFNKRKPGGKKSVNVDDETSSPVSGTVIRQLGEGEALPEIRKGNSSTGFYIF